MSIFYTSTSYYILCIILVCGLLIRAAHVWVPFSFLAGCKANKKEIEHHEREIIYSALFLQKPRAFHHMYACRYYYKRGRSDEYGTVERATHAKAMRCRIHTKNSMTNILFF